MYVSFFVYIVSEWFEIKILHSIFVIHTQASKASNKKKDVFKHFLIWHGLVTKAYLTIHFVFLKKKGGDLFEIKAYFSSEKFYTIRMFFKTYPAFQCKVYLI
jgi:thioredoxin-related protein